MRMKYRILLIGTTVEMARGGVTFIIQSSKSHDFRWLEFRSPVILKIITNFLSSKIGPAFIFSHLHDQIPGNPGEITPHLVLD